MKTIFSFLVLFFGCILGGCRIANNKIAYSEDG